MPRPPIHQYWRERVKAQLAQANRISSATIRRRLHAEAKDIASGQLAEVGPPPSIRSIDRIRESEWDTLQDADKAPYRLFYWPETMQRGELPWEASGAAFELMGHLSRVFPSGRPPLRLVSWFWRVSRAAPDAPIEKRLDAARRLAIWEMLGPLPFDETRGIEWFLAYAPWRSPIHANKYERAQERNPLLEEIEPIPPFPRLAVKSPPGLYDELLDMFIGVHISGVLRRVEKYRLEERMRVMATAVSDNEERPENSEQGGQQT